MGFLAFLSRAGQEGFEPPTRGFGDRCSTVGATGLYLPFFVGGVLSTSRAELAELELVLLLFSVLGRRVVPFFANGALERNDAAVTFRHAFSLLSALRNEFGHDARAHRPSAFPDCKPELFF